MGSGSERLIAKAHISCVCTCYSSNGGWGAGGLGGGAYDLPELSSYSLNADCCKKRVRKESIEQVVVLDRPLHRF